MIVLSGSSDQPQESMGAFQEFPQVTDLLSPHCVRISLVEQVESARLYSKYAARIPTLDRVPFFVEKVKHQLTVARPPPLR